MDQNELERIANKAQSIYGNNEQVEQDASSFIENLPDDIDETEEMIISEPSTPQQPQVQATPMDERTKLVKTLVGTGMSFDEAEKVADARYGTAFAHSPEPAKPVVVEQPKPAPQPVEEPLSITIQKESKADIISFPDSIANKIIRTPAIRLIEVEDESLKTINIASNNLSVKEKKKMLTQMNLPIARESYPLPALGDICTFRGAQIQNIAANERLDDDSLLGIFDRNVGFLYNHFVGGSSFSKFDENHNTVLTLQNFMDIYKYDDIDIGLYAIYCASGRESSTTSFKCSECKESFTQEYNIKELFDIESISEVYKKRIDQMLEKKSDDEFLCSLVEKSLGKRRIKSPHTGNIYDIVSPSLSRARQFLSAYVNEDEREYYLLRVLLYVETAFSPYTDPTTNKTTYINFGFDENKEKALKDIRGKNKKDEYNPIEELRSFFSELPQFEINFIAEEIDKIMFMPEFTIELVCPRCGKVEKKNVDPNAMVFLAVQAAAPQVQNN